MSQSTTAQALANSALHDPLPASLKPVKCLLVEDSAFDRTLLRYSAERAGVEIEFVDAATLSVARQSLIDDDFDLIILDRGLPDGDGLDLRDDLGEGRRNNGVPTVLISGSDDPHTVDHARIAGCADYLAKQDLSPEELSRVLNSVLQVGDAQPPMAEIPVVSTEFELMLKVLNHSSRISRLKPLVSRLVSLVSDIRRGQEDPSIIEEMSELCLMLWMEVDASENETEPPPLRAQ